jgi:hypothetical protein
MTKLDITEMVKDEHYTEFAPAERMSAKEISNLYHLISALPLLKEVIDAIPEVFLILNSKRQIVYGNTRILEMTKEKELRNLLGKRPGEVLNCIHSFENPGGCGTTLFCSECGAANAILESYRGIKSSYECRILSRDNQAYDLKVYASPYKIGDELLSFFAIQDIGNEKRRQALERVFYHDVMNTVGNLYNVAQLLKENPEEINEFNEILYNVVEELTGQILFQRQLAAAERGELFLNISEIKSLEVLNKLKSEYSRSPISENKNIIIADDSVDTYFESDDVLVRRVIGNLLKNALEATEIGKNVVLKSKENGDEVIFSVHNDSVIPLQVKLQLFKRSFSTKGVGRGLGTYSVKLFTENYLKGKVEYDSNEKEGTTFYIKLKKKF